MKRLTGLILAFSFTTFTGAEAQTTSPAQTNPAAQATAAPTTLLRPTRQRVVTVPPGTIVPILLDRKLSSQVDKTNDSFTLKAAADVIVDGMLVIAKDAPGQGHIDSASKSGMFGKPGMLIPAFDWVTGVDGKKIHMTGTQVSVGGDNTGSMVAGAAASTVAGAIIPFAGFATLLVGGRKAEIGTDKPYRIFVDGTAHVTSNVAGTYNDGYAH